MDYAEQSRVLLAQMVIKGLNRRNMTGEYCRTAEAAREAMKQYLVPGLTVSWGRSATLEEAGILDMFRNSPCTVYDRQSAKNPEESEELLRQSLFCDLFLLSANAVTADGMLVNLDGHASRISFMAFGPKKVVVVAGMNKVAPDLDTAIKRARNVAAPANALRIGTDTPCTKTGKCADCLSADCICCQMMITRRSREAGRIHVILVGEELGF